MKWLLMGFIFLNCSVHAQEQEIEQLLLDVEKLAQFKQILADMKEGYDLLTQGYNTVKDLSEGNFNLHQVFLDGLLQVSPTVQKYYKIAAIISLQKQTLSLYKKNLRSFQHSSILSIGEMDHFKNTCSTIINRSVQQLLSLTAVLTANTYRMSDAERLSTIDRLYISMKEQSDFMTAFTNSTGMLVLQRMKEQQDIKESKILHGVK